VWRRHVEALVGRVDWIKGNPIVNLLDKGRLRKAIAETIKKDLEFNVFVFV